MLSSYVNEQWGAGDVYQHWSGDLYLAVVGRVGKEPHVDFMVFQILVRILIAHVSEFSRVHIGRYEVAILELVMVRVMGILRSLILFIS